MRLRVLVAVVLSAHVLASGATGAAPRRVCQLLRGGMSGGLQEQMPDDSLVITSADIANNRTHLTAAIRMRAMKDTVPGPAGGRRFQFWYNSDAENTWVLDARIWDGKVDEAALFTAQVPAGGGAFSLHRVGEATTVIDGNELRITVPLSLASLSSTRRPKRLTSLTAYVDRMAGAARSSVPSAVPHSAVATEGYSVYGGDKVSYLVNTPSCVPVGR